MESIKELNLNQLEEVIGGRNEKGYEYYPKKIPAGCDVYKIQRGDTMKDIAKRYGLDTAGLMKLNKNIQDPSKIVAGFYLFVPE